MSILAAIIAVLALAGAVASWIAGGLIYRQAEASSETAQRSGWARAAFWPFLPKQVAGAPAAHAIKLNKALIAFFTCVMLAVAAISVATNLSRLSL